MYEQFKSTGFEIAAFPCNQFGGQEPWESKTIRAWVDEHYSIQFDLYSKVDVKGSDVDPLFDFLSKSGPNKNQGISWNFDGKFLVDRNGEVIKRWTNQDPLPTNSNFIGGKSEL